LIAFNTITHDSQGNAGERYGGIDLTFTLSDTVPLENNKLIQNEIAVDASGADLAADIRLFDRSALNGGAVTIFDNKIIGNDADPPDLEPPLLADHNVIQ